MTISYSNKIYTGLIVTDLFDNIVYYICIQNIPLNHGYRNGRFIVEIGFMCFFNIEKRLRLV